MKALTALPSQAYVQVGEEMKVPLQGLLRLVQELENNSSPAYIARYRSDVAAGLDERRINQVRDRLRSFLDLADRRITILTALSREDRLTPEMREKIESAMDRRTLEDLYLPFRPKPRTAADDALDKDLEPVARFIWAQEPPDADIAAEAAKLAPEGVSVEDALAGARAIIARWLAENVEVRRDLRKVAFAESVVTVSAIATERRLSARDEAQRQKAAALDGLSKPVSEIQWRQMLSIRRHARDRWLQYTVETPRDHCVEYLRSRLVRDAESSFVEQLELSAALAFDDFLAPSLGNEVRVEFEDRVDEEAVRAYSKNLRKVLSNSPAGAVPVIGLETSRPGGWRAVVIGANGEVLEHAIVREDPDRPSKATVVKTDEEPAQKKTEAEPETAPEAEAPPADESAPEAEAAPTTESVPEAEATPQVEAAPAADPAPEAAAAEAPSSEPEADPVPESAAEPEAAPAPEASAEPSAEQEPAPAEDAPAVEATEKAPDATLPFMAPTPDDTAGGKPAAPEQTATDQPAAAAEPTPTDVAEPAQETAAVEEPVAAEAAPVEAQPEVAAEEPVAPEASPVETQPEPAAEPTAAEEPPSTEVADSVEQPAAAEAPAAAAEEASVEASPESAGEPAAADQPAAGEAAETKTTDPAPEQAAAAAKPARQPRQKKQPRQQREQAHPKAPPPPHLPLAELLERHGVDLVAMGGGPRVRSVERFVRAEARKAKRPVSTVSVNEGGSWIYATSKNARRELPQLDPASRSAATLARRLQDSLSELVKIDPRVVGIGQGYQEVDQKRLRQALHDQVRSTVQEVGVDVNRASLELLAAAPGMTERVAKRIVERRTKAGPYTSREELHKTQGVSARVWEQAAGFLRVPASDNPLDATGVHPRHYEKLHAILAAAEVTVEQALENPRALDAVDLEPFVDDDFPKPVLAAMLRELRPQSITPRGAFKAPEPVVGVEPLDEPKAGMKVEGSVTNAAAFGVFVDIGAGTDGLVHVSQLSQELRDKGQDGIKTGDRVTVWITSVAPDAGRISLSMHEPREPRETSRQRRTSPEARRHSDDRRNGRRRDDRPPRLPVQRVFGPDREAKAKEESQIKKLSVTEKLSLLQDRFRTKTKTDGS